MTKSLTRMIAFFVLPLLGLVLGWAATLAVPQEYTSRATLSFVSTTRSNGPAVPNDFAQSRALSYSDVAASSETADRVAKVMGGDRKAEALQSSVRVNVPTGTSDMTIEATDRDPGEAQKVVQAYVAALQERVTQTERRSASLGGGTVAALVMADASPATAVAPPRTVAAASGFLLGGVLALGLAFLTRRRQGVNTARTVRQRGASNITDDAPANRRH